jgi:S-adenosylmethionine synthetase
MLGENNYTGLFTSESVSEGHPDKIADQIADAILDEILSQDKHARVACEVVVKESTIIVFGEITTTAWVDIEAIAKDVIKNIGYTDPEIGFDHRSCSVITLISSQSSDIAHSVDKGNIKEQGAGDQGMMFGFAIDETKELMPAAMVFANKLLIELAKKRKNKTLEWLRPDSKSQITVEYENGILKRIDKIVLSTQHQENITTAKLRKEIRDKVIIPTLPKNLIDNNTEFIINPSGRFVIGGPVADSGLSGRKIIVDTYGSYAHHGGGSFSGKDPSKVDRSGAYMARYIAKNIVAAKIAKIFEIQISYAIGQIEPTSVAVNSFGTSKYSNQEILDLIKKHFDLRPGKIVSNLGLLAPIYKETSVYGHFGKKSLPWEKTDKAASIAHLR